MSEGGSERAKLAQIMRRDREVLFGDDSCCLKFEYEMRAQPP
jgi:hypothetical protein